MPDRRRDRGGERYDGDGDATRAKWTTGGARVTCRCQLGAIVLGGMPLADVEVPTAIARADLAKPGTPSAGAIERLLPAVSVLLDDGVEMMCELAGGERR